MKHQVPRFKGCEDVEVLPWRRALTAPPTLNWLPLVNFTGSGGGWCPTGSSLREEEDSIGESNITQHPASLLERSALWPGRRWRRAPTVRTTQKTPSTRADYRVNNNEFNKITNAGTNQPSRPLRPVTARPGSVASLQLLLHRLLHVSPIKSSMH